MKANARKCGRRRAGARGRQVLKSRAGQAMTAFSLPRPVPALKFLGVLDVGRVYHMHVALSTPRALASSIPSKESTQLKVSQGCMQANNCARLITVPDIITKSVDEARTAGNDAYALHARRR